MTRNDCDAFTQGALDCAAWLAYDDTTGDPIEWGPGDAGAAVAAVRWDSASVARMAAWCAAFQRKAGALLADAYSRGYSPERAGHDWWLSRGGHGAGFWDRAELEAGNLGDALHAMCGHADASACRDGGTFYVD